MLSKKQRQLVEKLRSAISCLLQVLRQAFLIGLLSEQKKQEDLCLGILPRLRKLRTLSHIAFLSIIMTPFCLPGLDIQEEIFLSLSRRMLSLLFVEESGRSTNSNDSIRRLNDKKIS